MTECAIVPKQSRNSAFPLHLRAAKTPIYSHFCKIFAVFLRCRKVCRKKTPQHITKWRICGAFAARFSLKIGRCNAYTNSTNCQNNNSSPKRPSPRSKRDKVEEFSRKKQALFWATDRQGRDRPKRGLIYRVWARALMQAPLPPPPNHATTQRRVSSFGASEEGSQIITWQFCMCKRREGGGKLNTLARAGL